MNVQNKNNTMGKINGASFYEFINRKELAQIRTIKAYQKKKIIEEEQNLGPFELSSSSNYADLYEFNDADMSA